jgi:hypothetical protein
MRQITITAPQGSGQEIAKIAFAVGVSEVTIGEKRILDVSGSEVVKDFLWLCGADSNRGAADLLRGRSCRWLGNCR